MRAIWFGLLLLACSESATDARICAEAACESGFSIDVRSARPRDFTVKISSNGQVIHNLICTNAVQCITFFKDHTPAVLTLEVTTATRTAAYTYYPQYTTLRPNGDDCDPECKRADVSIILL
jgi:hypothetical protein